MKPPESRLQLIRQQVTAKILWGSPDDEVRIWLAEKHGIDDEAADAMLLAAHQAKRAAVRKKALGVLIASAIGLIIAVALLGPRFFTGEPSQVRFPAIFLGIAIACVLGIARSLWLLSRGEPEGTVE